MQNGRYAGWLFVLVPACFHPSYDHPTCGPNGECPSGLTCSSLRVCEEGASDSGPPDASLCFGSFITVCFSNPADVPTAPPQLPAGPLIEVDTGSSPLCDQHND